MGEHSNELCDTRVVIIEDHDMLNELIAGVVSSLPGFRVAGRAHSETESLGLCEETQPDLIVLDLVLPDSSGLDLIHEFTVRCAKARVVVLSGNLTAETIKRALTAGVLGLVSKTTRLEEFRAALLAAAQGRTYFSPDVADAVRNLVLEEQSAAAAPEARLTRREETVLSYLALGLTSREIARMLGVSVYTVANHRNHLMKKTGLRRATQLSLYAVRHRLLDVAGEAPRPL